MNTHPDGRFRIGNATLSPYVPGMPIADRHRRRYEVALESVPIIRAWCEQRGIAFRVNTNRSGHPHATIFKFHVRLRQDGAAAGWVPGLGRAWRIASCRGTTGQRLGRTTWAHLHDWHQLLNFLERWYESLSSDQVARP